MMREARLSSGLAGLAIRTALVAMAAVAAWAASGWALDRVADRVIRYWLRPTGPLPAFDVPAELDAAVAGAILPVIGWVLFAIGTTGLVSRGIPRRAAVGAACVLAVVVVADAVLADPAHRPMRLFPSELERSLAGREIKRSDQILRAMEDGSSKTDIARRQERERAIAERDFARADQVRYIMEDASAATHLAYLRAQIALHAGDQAALEVSAPALLRKVDRLAYAFEYRSAKSTGAWRSEVIHALDVALHGGPLSAVGIAFAEDAGAGGLPSALLAAAGVLLALVAVFCGAVSIAMGRRLRVMHHHVTAA
jgi:hypothetical protein